MLRDTLPDFAASNDLWRVMLASGERAMTLDALDEAFSAGHIDAATLVCPPGSLAFARLGAIAGLDDEAPPAEPDVSVDVDFDVGISVDDARAFRPRWSYQRLLAVPAALAAVAIIAFAAQASASSEALPPVPASAEPAAIAAPPPVAPPADPKPVAAKVSTPASPLLTDAQKKALAAKDKKAEASRNAKSAAATSHRGAAKKSSAPFSKGGNKHDPLNGAL
jgi:hypothetical protein